jgi:hypothetical protein
VYGVIQADGSTARSTVPMVEFNKFSGLMGFDWVASFEQAHAQND